MYTLVNFSLALRVSLLVFSSLFSQMTFSLWTDYDYQVDIQPPSNGRIGILFRYQDSDNFYRFVWDSWNSSRRLEKKVNGTISILAEDNIRFVTYQIYRLQLIADQANLTLLIDGNEIFSVNDSALLSGGVGLYNCDSNAAYYDNLSLSGITDDFTFNYDFSYSEDIQLFSVMEEAKNSRWLSRWYARYGQIRQTNYVSTIDPATNDCKGTIALLRDTLAPNFIVNQTPPHVSQFIGVTSTSNAHHLAQSVSDNAVGQRVIVWEDDRDRDGNLSVWGRWYDASGLATTPEMPLSGIREESFEPSVQLAVDGSAYLAYTVDTTGNGKTKIALAAFDENARAVNSPFIPNHHEALQTSPLLALTGDNKLWLSWLQTLDGNTQLMLQPFNSALNAEAAPISLTTVTLIKDPAIAVNPLGQPVIVYGIDQEGDGFHHLEMLILNRAGTQVIKKQTINTVSERIQQTPSIAISQSGRIAVSWQSEKVDQAESLIHLKQFDAAGNPFTEVMDVSALNDGYNAAPHLSFDAYNNLGVTWQSEQRRLSVTNVFARFYDAQGQAVSNAIVWPTNINRHQSSPIMANKLGSPTVILGDSSYNTYYQIQVITRTFTGDADSDGVADLFDRFPSDSAEFNDIDNDGIGDNADTDDDNDGLPDSYETAHGLLPYMDDSAVDANGDGVSNYSEYVNGSLPNDSTSCTLAECLPAIATISLSVPSIMPGESASISWQVVNAERVELLEAGNAEPLQSAAALEGSFSVSPQKSTQYTIKAISQQGEATKAITLEVFKAVAEYRYNALGQRVSKTVEGVTTYFVYGQSGELLAEMDQHGNPIREHIYLNGQPFAQNHYSGETATTYYLHNDHLGRPVMATDSQGNEVWSVATTPFGQIAHQTGTVKQPLQFPGQYKDDETGLSYNYYRDYDPATGRYVQSDPRGIMLDFSDPQRQIAANMGIVIPEENSTLLLNSPYNYVDQNPLGYTDWTGEFKGNPISDGYKLLRCVYDVATIPIDEYRKECQQECAEGKHGGNHQSCAWNKTKDRFKKCVELATPLK